MKKLFKFLRNIIFLNIFLVTGVITLYINNRDFKLWMNDTVDKYINTKPPPVKSIAYEPVIYESEVEILSQVQQDYIELYEIVQVSEYVIQEETEEAEPLPEDDIYIEDEVYKEETYETDIYIPPEEEITVTEIFEEPVTTQTPVPTEQSHIEEEPEYIVDNSFTGYPEVKEFFENINPANEQTGFWVPLGGMSDEQLAALNTAPWKEAGYNSLQEAWADFVCTQYSISRKVGGERFHQWCQNIVDGVGSKYDNYNW